MTKQGGRPPRRGGCHCTNQDSSSAETLALLRQISGQVSEVSEELGKVSQDTATLKNEVADIKGAMEDMDARIDGIQRKAIVSGAAAGGIAGAVAAAGIALIKAHMGM